MKTDTEWIEIVKNFNEELKDVFPDLGMRKDIICVLLEQIGTNQRTVYISQRRNATSESEQPTEKQIKYAKNLGIENPEKFSKKELSKLIDAKKGGKK